MLLSPWFRATIEDIYSWCGLLSNLAALPGGFVHFDAVFDLNHAMSWVTMYGPAFYIQGEWFMTLWYISSPYAM